MSVMNKAVATNDELAIITHYLHNKGGRYAKPYMNIAEELLKSLYNVKIPKRTAFALSDVDEPYSLFSEYFSVPFLPAENPKFTFIDLFAGIGGFRLAMQELGGKCVFSSEWDVQAQRHSLR